MGRAPCCDKAKVKRGPWSPDEDMKLKEFIEKHGTGGNWIALPHKAGLERCGKSCRLRWLNYLRPNIKHGEFSDAEDSIICNLYNTIGSRWSIIASHLPGRTDNDIKNYWNTKLKKKLLGITPSQRKRQSQHHQQQQFERRRQCFSSSLQPPADAGAESSSPLIQNPSTKSPLSGLRCGSQISQAHLLNSVSSGTALFQDPAHHFKVAGNSSGGALLGFGSGEGNSTPDIQHEHGGVGTAGGHWQHMSFGSLPCDEMLDGNHQGLSLADIVGGFDGGHHLVRENEGTAPWREAAPLMEDYGKYEEIKELITSRYPSRVQEEEWEITDLKRGPSTTTTIHCKKLEILFPRSIQGGACLVDDGDIDSRWLSEMGDANVMDDA